MLSLPIRWRHLATIAIAASLTCVFGVSTYAQKKPKITKVKPTPAKKNDSSVEPDKVLFDRANKDMQERKYIEARLDLQTLINTYPDSEYLAKAKLAVADSFYKEGGTSNFTQAVDEYKNFIVFFPFLEESAYAQMQVAMAHYRMMEKSDRDNSQAEDAESEFQIFLKKYPDSPLRPKAEQYLRNVQEVIADGEFRIARFYFTRARTNPADYPAAAARLMEVSQRYPLYSETDEALWMLGEVYERAKKFSKNEDDKNHWSDLASQCYSRIVSQYPLSKLAPDAKARLQGMGATVPSPDAAALARMEKDRTYEKEHRRAAALAPLTAFEASPSVAFAARDGDPNFNPPDDAVSATAVLKQGAAGPSFGIAAQQPAADSSDSASAPNIIEGSAVPTDSAGPPTTGVGAEIIEAPSSPAEAASSSSSSMSSSSSSSSSAPETTTAVISNVDSSTSGASAPATVAPAGASSIADQAPGAPSMASPQGPTPATQPVPVSGAGSSSSQAGPGKAAPATAPSADSSKESTSKKKKGLHKLVPF